jgi:long-chain acyl-CoA synthetase
MAIDVHEIKKSPWYKSYPQEIKEQMETYTLPEITVFRLLESSAKYYPQTTAILYEPENLLINYRELCNLSEQFAAGLQHRFGVKKGDRIAICSRNYPEFVIAFYGISMAGGIYVACNPLLIREEIEYQLKDSGAKIIITSDDFVSMAKELLDGKKTDLEKAIVFERDKELKEPLLGRGMQSYAPPFFKYTEVFSDKVLTKPPIDPCTDLAGIIYTSGTTGYPKGVMITHFNVVSSVIPYQTAYTGVLPNLDEDGYLKCINHKKDLAGEWEFPHRFGIDSVLVIIPWTHMMGFLAMLNYPVMAGLTIYPTIVFEVDSMLDMVRRWKIGFTGGPAQLMTTIMGRPDADEIDLSPIRAWTTGAGSTPVALIEKFMSKIGGFITEGYALTESTCGSSKVFCNRHALRKWGACGPPLPYAVVKIVDAETGEKEMPLGEEGELIQSGPTVTMGYWNRPEDTKDAYRHGWLYTGDLAKMDDDGFIHITGRKKELIKYKGYNIAPRMLEEILYKHPAVLMCSVMGKKDADAGELPVAFVSLKTGVKAEAGELMEFVNGQVAPYKKVREVRFIDAIPLNSTGKVNRLKLQAMLDAEQPAVK